MPELEAELNAYNAHVEQMKAVVAERDKLNTQLTELEQERQRRLGRLELLQELNQSDEDEDPS